MNGLNLPQVLIISRGLIFHKGKFLLIRREKTDTFSPDKWEIPGGKLDKGETLSENLLRETKEEVGQDFKLLKSSFLIYEEVSKESKYKDFLVLSIIGILKASSSTINLSHEHSEFKWVNFKEASKMDLTRIAKLVINEISDSNYLMDLLIESKALSRPNK